MTKGARNLIILGLASAIIALATTGVSLAVYHNSGDIYLDRSRPGYLPDKAEAEMESIEGDDYDFSQEKSVTKEVLQKYLEEFNKQVERMESYAEPFNAKELSDEKLGISGSMNTSGGVEGE